MKPRPEPPCAVIARWLPAAAVGAGDGVEQARVAAHLQQCAVCRATLAEYERMVGLLAYAVPPAEPSPRLRLRLMATLVGRG